LSQPDVPEKPFTKGPSLQIGVGIRISDVVVKGELNVHLERESLGKHEGEMGVSPDPFQVLIPPGSSDSSTQWVAKASSLNPAFSTGDPCPVVARTGHIRGSREECVNGCLLLEESFPRFRSLRSERRPG
jgi:hypothetical protein